MNLALVARAFDTVMTLRGVAKRLTGSTQTARSGELSNEESLSRIGQIENRLVKVVVAALKEAFNRDHARLEIERAQLEEQRRRAEEAMRLEIRRQSVDREIARLRMLAATSVVGWMTTVVLHAVRAGSASLPSRAVTAVGWVLLLGGLAAAFSAQGRFAGDASDASRPMEPGAAGRAALALVIAGLGVSAIGLLF
jgi:hypothetical protein